MTKTCISLFDVLKHIYCLASKLTYVQKKIKLNYRRQRSNMFKFHVLIALVLCLFLTKATLSTDPPFSKPGCEKQCGDLTVPYPFGMGFGQDGSPCAFNKDYVVTCNKTSNPPKACFSAQSLEITEIIDTKMRIKNSVDVRCNNSQLYVPQYTSIDLHDYPVVFSDSENKITAVGCHIEVLIIGTSGQRFRSGCIASCSGPTEVISGSCSGIGCCQTSIPEGVKSYNIEIHETGDDPNVFSYNPCSYGFLGEVEKFRFNVADLNDTGFQRRTQDDVTVVLEWYIGENQTCEESQRNTSSYACQKNTKCSDFESGASRGYRCSCLPGYHGNPYLGPAGCTDTDECRDHQLNKCSDRCTNTRGSYKCWCPKGYHGDGFTNGSRCTTNTSEIATRIGLEMSFGVVIFMTVIAFICLSIRRKKVVKQREKFFEKNGGILLKQQLSLYESRDKDQETFKVYTSEELRAVTDNYSEARILGKGGNGIVYKGILKDGSAIAVKMSKFVAQEQIEQFINELVILTQINHRNVVKLLGCCLETQVPVLVYEYISNGTLFEHINRVGGGYWLTWRNCVRLALEAADALSYLHSAASPPIIHRDVKSSNILIDDSFKAKISDFGVSRLIPIDQTRLITSVLGTHGYLDPEYLQTSQLTEKSDVYSFGVLVAELLTKQPPVSLRRKPQERNLASYFVQAMKEGRLLEIIDSRLVSEASDMEQIFDVAKLAKSCLSVSCDNRPTMKEVTILLDGLMSRINHASFDQSYEESTSLVGQEDLHPISSSNYSPSTGEASQQKDMLIEMNYPR